NSIRASDSWRRCRKRNYAMSIKRLFDVVERRGDIGRRVAALVLPISNRPRVTSGCAGKIRLREPGEHTSGPNLPSRDNVAHNPTLYIRFWKHRHQSSRFVCSTRCPSGALRVLCANKSTGCWQLNNKASRAQIQLSQYRFWSRRQTAYLRKMPLMPAPTLFQNEAANLTRSLHCSVELLSKCSSSRMSILPRWLTGAEIIAEDRQVIPQRHWVQLEVP